MDTTQLPSSSETGKLGLMHLKRYWHKAMLRKTGKLAGDSYMDETQLDKTALFVAGMGLEQAVSHILDTCSFEEFEDWILTVAGMPDTHQVQRFNQAVSGNLQNEPHLIQPVFTAQEISFFDENGYVILKNAISKQDCQDIIDAVCHLIGIKETDPKTWYQIGSSALKGIMVQLFQHPAMQKTRNNSRIRQAFEQLLGRTDIWYTVDRAGFNPPETSTYTYRGMGLHWDVSLQLPIPFGLQGLVYLTDTAADQGAFTLVPGFQNRVEEWLNSLTAGADPRTQDLHALGSKPIAANAGDLIIWHQALPHGSSPNRSGKPRFVQYITYSPIDEKHQPIWI